MRKVFQMVEGATGLLRPSWLRLSQQVGALAFAVAMAGCGGSSSNSGAGPAPNLDPKPPPAPQISLEGLKFWVGEQGPSGPSKYSGAHQQPFVCLTYASKLGQPEVDNQNGIGSPVFAVAGDILSPIVGYSAKCSVKTIVTYMYWNGADFKPFNPATDFAAPPADLKTVAVGDNRPFVIRVEAGTLNRFPYAIAMLASKPESTARPADLNLGDWNKKLVYYMRGGVGIGHQSGTAMFVGGLWSEEKQTVPSLLAQGYAVAASAANETGVHYNLQLGGETAVMLKEHFVQTYGKPTYTLALGISGGAVQQYVYAQNHKGLFDAGIPIQSYPDMVTQSIYVADCNLLEQYFMEEVMANPASMWATWTNRSMIEGLSTSNTEKNAFTGKTGSSECINSWGSATPLVLNPKFAHPKFIPTVQTFGWKAEAFKDVKWTHFNDLEQIYGVDAAGFAPIPWDNVGVQYGLAALNKGEISTDEFLRINACAGSWKEQPDFVDWDTANDPFDSRNMKRSANCRVDPNAPAPRRSGDMGAARAAYASGHVFTGKTLDIPLIDLRPYLEAKLDMHNSRQSFSARARLQAAGKDADKQVIWFTVAADLVKRVADAVSVLDAYLTSGNRPASFVDQCFNAAGATIGSGSGAWAGVLDNAPAGACTQAYPILSSPRMVAGDSYRGDMFKCALKPVETALLDGTFGPNVSFTVNQIKWLKNIMPNGVCDYSKPDQGRPAT